MIHIYCFLVSRHFLVGCTLISGARKSGLDVTGSVINLLGGKELKEDTQDRLLEEGEKTYLHF